MYSSICWTQLWCFVASLNGCKNTAVNDFYTSNHYSIFIINYISNEHILAFGNVLAGWVLFFARWYHHFTTFKSYCPRLYSAHVIAHVHKYSHILVNIITLISAVKWSSSFFVPPCKCLVTVLFFIIWMLLYLYYSVTYIDVVCSCFAVLSNLCRWR